MLRKLCTGGLLVAGMMAAPVAFSQSVHQALSELESIMADDSRRDAAYAAGKERILFCGSCHGKDGNSRRDYIPNLADQHPLYLFEQFAYSRPRLPLIPDEACHPFHAKAATDSTAKLPPWQAA